MPYPNGYIAPKKASVKATSRLRKDLKENDLWKLTHIEELLEDAHCLKYPYNGIHDNIKILLNNPDGFEYHSDKTAETLYTKVNNNIHTLLNEFPEYVAEQNRLRIRQREHEDIENLANTHWLYNHAQYQYDSNSYEVNQNRAGWIACIGNIFRNNPNRSGEWYEKLYTHLKNKDNFTLTFDANESISIGMHTSCWSYWSILTFEFESETISSGKCSYRNSEVNRV